jgi:hypothetical protein
MKRIMAVSLLAIGLAGCNATVYDTGYRRPHAVIDLQTPAPVYVAPRPYYEPAPRVMVLPPRRPRCEFVEYRSAYGIRRERVCH